MMHIPSLAYKRCLALLFCTFAYSVACFASAPNEGTARDSYSLPAPPMQQPTLSAAQIKSLEDSVTTAKDLATLVKLEKQIALARGSCALNVTTAKKLTENILAKERQLDAPNRDIAITLSDLADCYPLEEMNKAIPFRKEALAIAIKASPRMDIFVIATQNALVRELVITHASRAEIVAVSPICPHCHTRAQVLPVFGMMPYSQKDYGYGFVNGSCSPDHPNWYCRKCKGSFYPYSTKAIVMDEKPQ